MVAHRRRNQGGNGPHTFSGLTHPLLPYAKHKHWNLSILPFLLSALSQEYASFIAALLDIDCFCMFFHCFFNFTMFHKLVYH